MKRNPIEFAHWNMILIFVILCVFLCQKTPVRAEVTVRNSAYQDVLVSFSSNLQPEKAEALVKNTKELFRNVSSILQHTIGISIGKIIFRLPDTWDTSSWETNKPNAFDQIELDSAIDDFTVSNAADSAFGSNPFTLQYAGCGMSGQPVVLTSDFIIEDSEDHYPKDKLVAREWLKYRYGVFEENGFPGDPLYPSIYKIPGAPDELQVTECTNEPVQYQFRDKSGTNCTLESGEASECWNDVDFEEGNNVTSSLMYWHKDLNSMKEVCGKEHNHNNIHPNKQNVLCGGQSIWDVLELSSDFNHTGDTKTTVRDPTPELTVIQDTKPRTAIVLEDSKSLQYQKRAILFAVNRLFYDLRTGTQFALYTYNQDTEVDIHYELAVLEEKRQLTTGIANFLYDGAASPVPACGRALDDMQPDENQRGTVILISGSELSEDDKKSLIEKFSGTSVCLCVVTFTNSQQETPIVVNFLDSGDTESCHKHWQLTGGQEDEVIQLQNVYAAMLGSVSKNPPAVQLTNKVVGSGEVSFSTGMSVPHDPLANHITLWLYSSTPITMRDIECKVGENALPFEKGITSGASVSFVFKPPESEGICKLKFTELGNALVQVQVTTSPENNLKGEIWIHNPTIDESSSQAPVLIFAHVTLGGDPIHGASVVATVTGPDQTALITNQSLYDDGSGVPDLTEGDGVYSGYFIEFQGIGTYNVAITVSNEGDATAGKNGSVPCCGQSVKSTPVGIPPFRQTLWSTFDVVSPRPDKGFPPSRILDLKVLQTDPLILQWTAPGGQMDRGKATRYEFKAFCQETCTDTSNWITYYNSTELSIPKDYGKIESATLQLTDQTPTGLTIIGIAVTAINADNLRGTLSNRAPVFINTDNLRPTTDQPTPNGRSLGQIGRIAGISAAVVFILVTLGSMIWTFYSRAKKINKPRSESNKPIAVRSDSFKAVDVSAIQKNESFPVLLYTHDRIKDIKEREKQVHEPLYRTDGGPKPWTSLDILPGPSGFNDTKDSVSMVDNVASEMRQLDNVSGDVEMDSEKIDKF